MENDEAFHENLQLIPNVASSSSFLNQEGGANEQKTLIEAKGSSKKPQCSPSICSKSSAASKFTPYSNANQESSESYLSETSTRSQDTSPRSSMDNALKSEKAFIEYVMSLPTVPLSPKDTPHFSKIEVSPASKTKHKSCSVVSTTTNATKVGLDHLDNLCKLMEQLSELKETNAKLQKRVQYLEDLKTLHEMHKEIRREVQYGSENVLSQRRQHMCLKKSLTSSDYVRESPRGSKDYVSCLPRGSTDYFFKEPLSIRNSRSPSGRRSRTNNSSHYEGLRRERSKSVGHEEVYDSKSKRIFPKWSKVKEALGWESERKETAKASKFNFNASTTKTSNEEVYFSENRRILTDNDIAALRIPIYSEYCEKDYAYPTDSYAGEAMATCGEICTVPYNSSAEDINRLPDGFYIGRKLKQKSLTIEREIDAEQAFAKFEKEDSKKPHKSPWGRVKTIIEKRRDSLKRRTMRKVPEPIIPAARSQDLSHIGDEDQTETACRYDYRRKSSDDQLLPNSILSKVDRHYGEADKICKKKKQVITDQGKEDDRTRKAPSPLLHINTIDHFEPLDSRIPVRNSDREVGFRTPGSSPQFHRKSTWMKMKNVLRSKKEGVHGTSSQSMPSSPNGVHDGHFDFEDSETLGETPEELECYEDGHGITRVGSDSFVHKLSESVPVSDIMLELQRNISEDFTRKMEEWERIRNSGIRPTTSPKWERKNSSSKTRKKSEKQKAERYEKPTKPKVKDLTWLEKELQKIEKEKQRLSREKEKYEERAVRLERLRQTVLAAKNSNKKEVLVRTSAGEFRFEGISDAFTKKLYEWETKRGVGPELSTIALLDSSLGPNKNSLTIQHVDKAGNLHRGLSRSESSVAEIGQHSQTSSNSLPSLKPTNVECGDLIGIHQYSRANSEPDLFSFMNKPSNNNNNQNRLSKQNNSGIENTSEDLGRNLRESYVHPEVTQLIDSDADETMCDEDGRQEQRDENYYSLLEENVILLEQLKSKEEICKRLEKELKLLDGKVEEMNKHHQQEMEKYREKLWEMHKPGNTPREVQGCLQVMVELRSRIENLENCSEKLKTEKETLEDSFRFHSAEQEHMTLDLLDKMRELQEAGSEPQKGRNILNRRELPQPNFDLKIVERLQDLSSQLVKQTRELEHALAERTQQICQLRWELLHRDVSTVKLETELHSAHIQGSSSQSRSKCEEKRTKYAHFRSWSSEEASKRAPQECKAIDHLRPSEFQDTYYKQSETKFQASKLTDTVHELNRELIRLSSAAESLLGGQDTEHTQDNLAKVAEKENDANYSDLKLQQTNNAEDSLLCSSSEASLCDISSIQKNEAVSKISVRRNSVGSISMASGRELSESSSINDERIKCFPILKASSKIKQTLESSTSSSDSDSTTEDSFVKGFFNPQSTIGGEVMLKQIPIKKITTHDKVRENRESSSPIQEIKHSQQGLKKRMSYKGIKTTRKNNNRSGQSVSPLCSAHIDEKIHKHNMVIQSESDTAIGDRSFKYGDVGKKGKTEVNSSFLRPCQSADQVTVRRKVMPKHSIKDNINKAVGLSKGILLPTCQNRTGRRIEQHSKDEKPHIRSSIRKSESLMNPKNNVFELHEAKRSKSMKISKDVLAPPKLQEIDKTRSSSCKKKIRSGKTKEILNISTVPKLPIISNSSIECGTAPAVTEAIHYNSVDTNTRQFPHIDQTGTESTLIAKIKSIPYLSLKQQLFISEKQDDIQNNDLMKASTQSKMKNDSSTQNQIPMSMAEFRENQPSIFIGKLPKRKIKGSKINNSKVKPRQDDYNYKSMEERANIIPNKNIFNHEKQIENRKKTKDITINRNQNILLDTSTLSFINDDTSLDDKQPNKEISAYEYDLPYRENLRDGTILTYCKKSDDISYCETETKNILCDHQTANTNSMNEKISQISNDSKDQNIQETKIIENAIIENQHSHHLQVKQCSPTYCQDTSSQNKDMTNNYRKSPSAPQLDWKKTCAKKLSREGAPNVKSLIDKYNQKVLENQSKENMYSSAYNSPVTVRKISAPPERNYSQTHIPCTFSSTPNSPRIISSVYNSMMWKPSKHISYNPLISPPTSPSSKARSIALQTAKEKFISTSSITHYIPENMSQKENRIEQADLSKTSMQFFSSKLNVPNEAKMTHNETKSLVADSNLVIQKLQTENLNNEKVNNRKSISSTRSIDSMSFVIYKTGETCQESRLLKRNEKQKLGGFQTKTEETIAKPSKSLSNSSIFRAIKGPDIKFPSSFLRLRRSPRKKDMATVSQLCRQSLLVSGESSAAQADQPIISKSPRSCPSSPELKSKNKVKGSWLQRNIFWHK